MLAPRFLKGLLVVGLVALLLPIGGAARAAPSLEWQTALPGAAVFESSPLAIDVDGGGDLEIVFGAHDRKVYVLKGSNGANAAGWPRATTHKINSSPSAADTDGDGRPEIFIGVGVTDDVGTANDNRGALYSFEHDGGERFRFIATDNENPSPTVHSTAAIGDINSSNTADVSFGGLSLLAWSLDQSGRPNGGWPFYWDDSQFGSPALADIDADGQTDVIMTGDSTPGGPTDHRGGLMRVIKGSGQLIWEHRINEMIRSSPSVGDVDGDGQIEIVHGGGLPFWNGTEQSKVFVLNRFGLRERVFETGAQTPGSPTLADVNGDGRLDIAIGTFDGGNPGKVWAWDGASGNTLPGFNGRDSGGGVVLGQITTADLNGDGGQDLLVPTGAGVFVYNGKNGSKLFDLAVGTGFGFQNSPVVTDVDGDSRLDIVIVGFDLSGNGRAFRYEMAPGDGAVFGNLGWHTFRKDARRTGSWTNPPLTQSICPPPGGGGYWMGARDGGIFAFCDAPFKGSTGGIGLAAPIVGMSSTKSGNGYWMVASDGGVFSFGDAAFRGSTGSLALASPIVGMARTPSGNGYWMVAGDGGVFSFGDAKFHGSTGGMTLNQPIVGIASSNSGNGYWLVARDGGIFAFGDAVFRGSTGRIKLNQPIVSIEATSGGNGYWMVASDGGIFAFGDAAFHGSTGGIKLNRPIVDMSRTPGGGGYWMVASDGGIFAFNAPFLGSTGSIRLNQPIVGMAAPGV